MKQIESLFLGILAALGALVSQSFILLIIGFFIRKSEISAYGQKTIGFSDTNMLPLLVVIPIAVLVEEIFKYVIIVKRVDLISYGRSLLFNSLLVGLGFAGLEAFLIYSGFGNRIISSMNVQNVIEIISIHIFTAGIIGYYVATRNPKKIATFFEAVFIAFLIHLTYNVLALYRGPFLNPFIFALLAVLFIINFSNFISINKKLAS